LESLAGPYAEAAHIRLFGAPHDGDYLFVEANRRMLAEDTPEWRKRDRETVEACYRAQGRDRAVEVEGAKEKLLAKLETRGKE
jgi:hypothetical protein